MSKRAFPKYLKGVLKKFSWGLLITVILSFLIPGGTWKLAMAGGCVPFPLVAPLRSTPFLPSLTPSYTLFCPSTMRPWLRKMCKAWFWINHVISMSLGRQSLWPLLKVWVNRISLSQANDSPTLWAIQILRHTSGGLLILVTTCDKGWAGCFWVMSHF